MTKNDPPLYSGGFSGWNRDEQGCCVYHFSSTATALTMTSGTFFSQAKKALPSLKQAKARKEAASSSAFVEMSDCARAYQATLDDHPGKSCIGLSLVELRKLASVCNIKGRSKMNKEALCQALEPYASARTGILPPELVEAIVKKT